MPLDTKKYPLLGDLLNPPLCKECDAPLIRDDTISGWFCLDPDCDALDETDAQLDNRLTSDAESSYEHQQSSAMGGGSFLSPDAMQRSLKR